jgi:signal transduction histidine kinase/ActR/RegA family two-component response regulator
LVRAFHYVIRLLLVGGVYWLVATAALDLAALYPAATVIWPAAGFALAAVLLGGYRVVPAIFVAAFLVNALRSGWSTAAAATAAGNTFEAFAGGYLINRWAEGRDVFAAPDTNVKFVLIAMLVSAICAGVGVAVNLGVDMSILTQFGEWPKLAGAWLIWWLGDLAAVVVITPVLVLWATSPPRSFALRPLVESTAIFAAAGAVGVVAFSPLLADDAARGPLGVFSILPLLWAALRRGPRDTATAGLIVAGFAVWGTLFTYGPLAASLREEPLLLLAFLIAMVVPGLTLAADAVARRRAEKLLRDSRQDLEQARAQFAQAQKMEAVGQLTGGVAHDFNNLLTVILGNLDMAQRQLDSLTEAPAERLRRVINNAVRGAQRATTITQRLLAFSRKQPLEPRPLNVNKLLDDMADFMRRSLGETVGLDIVPADDLWQVEADPAQLESALLNLAVNARDAMSDGGRLTIETGNSVLSEQYCQQHDELVPGQYVQIAVSDTGSGMSKEVVERVFEPFFTTKEPGQGTGLGLSQVYGFVKQSGGHIQIESEPGAGTTVRIYLPRLLGGERADHAAEREVDGDMADTILLVEDDHDVRAYVVEILRELHYRVLEAHDADAALAMVDRNDIQVDLLLTDVVLPGMNGRQLAEELKRRQPGIRVLFMSGYSRDAIVYDGRLEPGVELMQKPLTQEVVAQRVRAVLDGDRQSRKIGTSSGRL